MEIIKIGNYVYGENRKRDLFGGIASGVGSIVNGILGKRSADKANATNIMLTRETNALQQQMQREQNQWNYDTAKEFFDMENAYNDPSAVRARLENAGINPQLALSGDGTSFANGDASTPQSAFSPSITAPSINPAPSVLNGVLPEIANTLKTLGEAKKLGIDTKYYDSLLQEELKSKQLENNYNELRNMFAPERMQSELTNIDLSNDKTSQEINKINHEINSIIEDVVNKQKQGQILDTEKEIKNIEKKIASVNEYYSPLLNKEQLSNLIKQGNNIVENTRYTKRQTLLLGRTINGIEVDKTTLDAYKSVISKEIDNDKVKKDVESILNQIERNELSKSSVLRFFKRADLYVSNFPVVKTIIDAVKGVAKAKGYIK